MTKDRSVPNKPPELTTKLHTVCRPLVSNALRFNTGRLIQSIDRRFRCLRILNERIIACALIEPQRVTRRVALSCAIQRRGGRVHAQEEQESSVSQNRSAAAGLGSQPQFPSFSAELQVCYGAIHLLVLLRTAPCSKSRCCSQVPPQLESLGLAAGTINQRLAA